ncbi:hypothetical protein [Curtobacterium sp. MCSS17_007]|uniref:hypothetical protein n=1 Tax=Curtobacterium sp. MCSS17_007 TaxID=2175646 RepID=UPI000DA94A37|nr:hypothetical protein [Curtobacterium sp. MCSS17_007]WIE76959.1 hypothetical protein DEJ22_006805 [Curtobacterium sp. MCSS17_007]
METQPGARTPLVDPFGRELEEWLRDVPAPRTPYLADLVVPPVTGPVQRPVMLSDAAARTTPEPAAPEQPASVPAAPEQVAAEQPAADRAEVSTSFRRRDRARHVAACAPSFPEPPARLALRIEDLAVEVSAASGRTTVERIELLEDEVRRRDEDLARLAAWEVAVADIDDAEVEAARGFARAVFADLLADAADEAERRERAAARRAATVPVPTPVRQAVAPGSARTSSASSPAVRSRHVDVATTPAVASTTAGVAAATTDGRDEPIRPLLSLQARTPVSANTRPTPLVQPATGPTVIDRAAFAAALTAHAGTTASTPVVLPEAVSVPTVHDDASTPATAVADGADGGWWTRLVSRLRALFGRR